MCTLMDINRSVPGSRVNAIVKPVYGMDDRKQNNRALRYNV